MTLLTGQLKAVKEAGKQMTEAAFEKVFLYCLTWALGGLLETKERPMFDQELRSFAGSMPPREEEGDTIFEYLVRRGGGRGEHLVTCHHTLSRTTTHLVPPCACLPACLPSAPPVPSPHRIKEADQSWRHCPPALTHPPACLPTLPAHPPAPPACLSACLPAPPACLPTHLPHLPAFPPSPPQVNESDLSWMHWKHRVPIWSYPVNEEKPKFAQLVIPTLDSVRFDKLLTLAYNVEKSTLLVGGAGTAKTSTVMQFIGRFNAETTTSKVMTFSFLTTPQIFQITIESSVEKRQGRTYGPPGGKQMCVFIDDISMPYINEWNDQVTNEIVRQLLEQGGMYSLDKPIGDMKFIVDTR